MLLRSLDIATPVSSETPNRLSVIPAAAAYRRESPVILLVREELAVAGGQVCVRVQGESFMSSKFHHITDQTASDSRRRSVFRRHRKAKWDTGHYGNGSDGMRGVVQFRTLTDHRVIEVGTSALEDQHRLAWVLRQSSGEDQAGGTTSNDDVVVRLARNLVERREEIAHVVSSAECRCIRVWVWAGHWGSVRVCRRCGTRLIFGVPHGLFQDAARIRERDGVAVSVVGRGVQTLRGIRKSRTTPPPRP